MKIWHFSEEHNTFLIHTPFTPRPWINYLTNGDYFALTSQTGGGFSFFLDPLHHALTRREQDLLLNDRPGRFVFIQDLDKSEIGYWNIGGNPSSTSLDKFTCSHGFGYTRIESSYRGIDSSQTMFVCTDENAEVWSLSFTNNNDRPRSLRILAYLEWMLGNSIVDPVARRFDSFFKHVFVDRSVVIGRKLKWGLKGSRENKPWQFEGFATATRPADQIWLDKEEFIGSYRDLARPVVLEEPSRRPAHPYEVWAVDALGTQEWTVELEPGQNREWQVVVGIAPVGEGVDRALALADTQRLEAAQKEAIAHWNQRVRKFWVHTPDFEFTRLHQGWSSYQILIKSYLSSAPSYYHASDGSPGFRDGLQDAFGLAMLEPERAREMILRLVSFQFLDGAASHRAPRVPLTVEPSEKSDMPLWISLALLQYIRETGDTSLITEKAPFADGPEAPLLEHIRVGLERSLNDTGRHGLPLIHYGDWNDALDGLGGEGRGESVFLGQFLAYSLKNGAVLAELADESSLAEQWKKKAEELVGILNNQCWDKDRFVRALHDDGTVIGCSKNREGSIYLNPQVWAVIADLAPRERQEICMDTVERELDTPIGIRCLAPPYSSYDPHVGLISCFPPGVKENGAVFSQAMAFCLVAELMLKRAEKAWEIFCKANPVLRSRQHPEYSVEPYVYSQFVAGPETNLHGQGFHHWLTSTCSWMQYAVVNWMLGARADLDGLILDPCIPPHWKEFNFTRLYRQSTLNIEVKNPKGLSQGVKKVLMDGKPIAGNKIPPPEKKEVEVKVILG